MKRLPLVILLVWVLVAVVMGCGGAHRYDARLTAADSLMQPAPDSALALIEALPPDSLTDEGDRAYRDLLLTQSRYRCYITATSDSGINRALAYYRAHSGEREKLTRAYIYKGAVMEELGHPDSAMYYYKHAEATAAPDDYFNLGYVNMRMGALYRDYYAMDGKDVNKYEEALECLNHTDYQVIRLKCMINLGSLYRLKQSQKAEQMLMQARDIARDLHDTASIIACEQNLISMYNYYGRYHESRPLVQEILSLGRQEDINTLFYTESAIMYLKIGEIDSVDYLLSFISGKTNGDFANELSRIQSLSELALARGDSMTYLQLEHQAKLISDSLLLNEKLNHISFTEQQMNKSIAIQDHDKQKRHILWLVALFVAILLTGLLFYFHHIHRYDKIIKDFKQQSDSQCNDMNALNRNIERLQIQDGQLKQFISTHLELMSEMIEACYHAPRNVLAKEIQRIVRFQDQNKHSWEKLYDYIDIEFNNIMTETRRNYPKLTDRDLLLLALTCLGYSCAQIAIIFDYANATTISSSRQRLAKKMGLNTTLKEYIEQFQIHE